MYRRLDVFLLGLGLFLGGGILYEGLTLLGLEAQPAQLWASCSLSLGLVAWVITYLLRVFSGKMSLHEQQKVYEVELLKRKLDLMTPEELLRFQNEIEAESKTEEETQKPS
jgi:hypothetical protein